MLNFKLIAHSAIKLTGEKNIYIDPYLIPESYNDADYIFCTHLHYDHFSKEDILKVMKKNTIFVVPTCMEKQVEELGIAKDHIITVMPNMNYIVNDLKFSTYPAYNLDKEYHKKEDGFVGYVIYLNGIMYYIAGDTDDLEELHEIKCDIAFLPVGGKYTMNAKEAANLANTIVPDLAVPTHYGSIVGSSEDAVEFTSLLIGDIKSQILIY